MGNNRFRLSSMMPNAWFYKLRDMSQLGSRSHSIPRPKNRSHLAGAATTSTITPKPTPPHQQVYIPNRTSHYYPSKEIPTTEKSSSSSPLHLKAIDAHFLTDPPRRSKRSRRPLKPCAAPELHLPPILTKPDRKATSKAQFGCNKAISEKKSYNNGNPVLQIPARRILQGIKIRASSPRLPNRKTKTAALQQRNCLRDSFAIAKPSSDPQRDFRESMVEMIVENDIRSSGDLEELLTCYLTLNMEEYHDIIVKVFREIWFELISIRI